LDRPCAEIDHIDAKSFEARLARLLHVLGSPIHRVCLTVAADLTKFGRQHHLVSSSLDRPPDNVFIVAPAVHVGGIEVIDANVYGVVDQRLRLSILGCAVDTGQ
jgi:hypothetical protein